MAFAALGLALMAGLTVAAGNWTQLSGAGWSPRSGFQMAVPGNSVIVAGGTDDPSRFYNDAYRMTLSDGLWSPLPFSSPQWPARASFGMSAYANGTLVLTGGQQEDGGHASLNDVWALDAPDSSTPQWRQLPNAPWKHRVGHAQSTCKDRVVITGGASTDAGVFISVYSDVWSMASDGSWTEIPGAPWHKRFLHSTTCLSDGSLVLAGGHSGFSDFSDVWLMSPDGKWKELTAKAPFSTRVRFSMVSFADDSVLVGEGMSKEDFWIAENVEQVSSWRSLGRPPFSERYDYGLVALPSNTTTGKRTALVAGGMLLSQGIHNYNEVYRLVVDGSGDSSMLLV
eukprot:TRINITY_DN66423_c0_g1_i1.p1 TRINITY_DN66423_c0_g1~~TRINITY_DN66423_c0_g1_i1.p1  ORF type:complete len:340 (+),score=41.15 TRINITY_DN66423_c0_g1_i1:69-1088(+)